MLIALNSMPADLFTDFKNPRSKLGITLNDLFPNSFFVTETTKIILHAAERCKNMAISIPPYDL